MANSTNKGGELRRCSFCGRVEHQVNFLIPSPDGVYICDFCVEACAELIDEAHGISHDDSMTGTQSFGELNLETLPRPMQIKAALDE